MKIGDLVKLKRPREGHPQIGIIVRKDSGPLGNPILFQVLWDQHIEWSPDGYWRLDELTLIRKGDK